MVTHFGEGPTAAIALDEAIALINSSIPSHPQLVTYSQVEWGLANILGIHREPIKRRF